MSEKNPLDFALREDEEALKKGRGFSFLSLSLSLFFVNASRRRYANADDNGGGEEEAQNKMRSHYMHW